MERGRHPCSERHSELCATDLLRLSAHPGIPQSLCKASIHNKQKQTLRLPWSLATERKGQEGELSVALRTVHTGLCLYLYEFLMRVDTVLLQQREKSLKGRCKTPPERSFSGLMTLLTLISSAWELMMMRRQSYRWSWSNVGADYLILLSNWPESCSFSSAQLGYLNLISVHKSIWGFVFILVCWECWRKRESIIHNSPTWLMRETQQPGQTHVFFCV